MSDLEDALPQSGRRRWFVAWFVLLAAAWLLYESTRAPALAGALVALKFGWADFDVAWWLLRRDPLPWRRWGTFYLYLAAGLWKIAVVAFLLSIGFAVVTQWQVPAGNFDLTLWGFIGSFLTALLAIWLSALLSVVSGLVAWCGGNRLWLDGAVRRAKRYDFWPPTPFCLGRRNRLAGLILTSLAVWLLAVVLLLVYVLQGTTPLILLAAAPGLLVIGREWVSAKVKAEQPEECWGEPW